MSRTHRYRNTPAFDAPGFDEQLYAALAHSPWWTLSLTLHALLFVIASLLVEATPPAVAESAIHVVQGAVPDEVDDPEEIPDPPPDVNAPEAPPPEPDWRDVEISDHTEIDLQEEFDEDAGDNGPGDGTVSGPGANAVIGLGPDAGSRFGRPGRGGDEDLRLPRGRAGSEAAIEDALRWLAAHQSPDGGWEASGWSRWCDGKPVPAQPDGLGKGHYDVGVTGLAALAFLGAGYTHRGHHPFARTLQRALRYLRNVQDAEGCLGSRASQHFIYNHATAALALVEAYGMTESPILRGPAQKALDFICLSRNPYFVWRYGVRPGDNDTSVTGWMMMALKSARLVNEDAARRGLPARLTIDEEAFDGIRAWIDKVTDPDTGRVGYVTRGSPPARPQHLMDRYPTEASEALTAVGVLARIFTGEDPRGSDAVRKGAALCARVPPTWETSAGQVDMYYWYYATLALYQVGGSAWKQWNGAMKPAIVDHQRTDGTFCDLKGSWDPIGPWGEDGGRVYSTALMAMCLEVYYRYPRVFGTGR